MVYINHVSFVTYIIYVVGSFAYVPAYNPSETSCLATDTFVSIITTTQVVSKSTTVLQTDLNKPMETALPPITQTSYKSSTPIIIGDLSNTSASNHDNTKLYVAIGVSVTMFILIILIVSLLMVARHFFRLALYVYKQLA